MGALTLVLGCLVWIPIAAWVVSLIHWMIGGDIDAISGMAGVLIALSLGYFTFVPPIPGMAPYTFGAVVLTVLIYPAARAGMARKQLAAIDIEGVDEAYELLGQRPNNPLARLKLAKHLFALGLPGWSIAIADTVLPMLPERAFMDEHRMVRNWKRMPQRAGAFRQLTCVECGNSNAPGYTHCTQCGEPFLRHVIRGRFLPSRVGRKLVAAWISLVAILAGMPAATSLPPALAGLTIFALMVLAGGILFVGFRSIASDNS